MADKDALIEAEREATLYSLAEALVAAYAKRQEDRGRRQRIDHVDAIEIIHHILQYQVRHGL